MVESGNTREYELKETFNFTLGDAESRKLRNLINSANITTIPPIDCVLGFDAPQWVMELAGPEGYHLVKRIDPSPGSFRDVGQHLLALVGWDSSKLH
jgi:hypothetical protein